MNDQKPSEAENERTRRSIFDVLEELAASISEGDSPVAYALLALGFTVGVALRVGVPATTITGLLFRHKKAEALK